MSPAEFYIDGKFCGRTAEGPSGVVVESNPRYLLWWSGDNSKELQASVWLHDGGEHQKKFIASSRLSKVGDSFSTLIDIYEKVPLFKDAVELISKELKGFRI